MHGTSVPPELGTVRLTVLDDHVESRVEAELRPAADGATPHVRLAFADVERALGFTRKPQGWCRGDLCVPTAAVAALEDLGEAGTGTLDVTAFAALLNRPVAVELSLEASAGVGPDEGVVAFGVSAADRSATLTGGTAPDFALPDVHGAEHRLGELRGRKVALVFWASWCGCRYDLPEWERQHAALADEGFSVLSVAVDRRIEDAAPWIAEAAPTHPALIDVDGRVADQYQLLNVPTVVWIDEEGRIARPNDTQFATDLFRSMSGLDSTKALAALRRWVTTGDTGLHANGVAELTHPSTPDRQLARTEAALALWLLRNGQQKAAERHFAAAAELAPEDVTTWRSAMPLLGVDPMGEEYFARRAGLEEAGVPIYRPLPDWQ
ncbi:TlpA disulfide reductase family protein [Streptomyces flavofungini]|uniref:TlpA disulfide reductase family protein n=1 Tax=Streptomyces flavofungini TaxID=68200 RepID=UPI0025B060D9|nr:TlpA disulfide reductase family protein [Streptomyces flavofungini]WJV47235.1 TlpA disulfide reductase family protein [Streptomyces flavofungini]